MTIFIDADETLVTWGHISEAGNFRLYRGRARQDDVVIRWGANHGRYDYPAGVRVLNPNLVLSKAAQGRILEEGGVPIPTIFKRRTDWERAGRPQVIMKPWHGQEGRGIAFTTNPLFGQKFVIQRYIDKDREFRAMMVHDLIAFFMEKLPNENGDFRWNKARGAHWIAVPDDARLRRAIENLGYQALQALGYDFGACDIIKKDDDFYILEVNSRPELGPNNAARFARAIRQYLDRE